MAMWADLGLGILQEFVSAEAMRPATRRAHIEWWWRQPGKWQDPFMLAARRATPYYREAQKILVKRWKANNRAKQLAHQRAHYQRNKHTIAAARAARKAAQ